jgi:hypothetical protein
MTSQYLIKILLVLHLFAVLVALFRSLFLMMNPDKSPAVVVSLLSWRIGLSIFLFVLGVLFFAWMP